MGMYIANKVMEENNVLLSSINQEIKKSTYQELFDVNDCSLVAPTNMSEAINKLLKDRAPANDYDLLSSIYHSMAYAYQKAIKELETITNHTYSKIAIIGGGAKNEFLNQLVNKYTGKQVIPMPIEATCLGNIKIQMKARGINHEKRS